MNHIFKLKIDASANSVLCHQSIDKYKNSIYSFLLLVNIDSNNSKNLNSHKLMCMRQPQLCVIK